MGIWLRGLGGWAVVLAALTVVATASADLPPAPGTKSVGYGFKIENLKAFGDFVLFAYPWKRAEGASHPGHVLLSDGETLRVGRLGSQPRFYAMKRAAYDDWRKHYVPTQQSGEAALESLVKSAQVVACDKSPSLRFWVSSGDSRKEIIDVFQVGQISKERCQITPVWAKPLPGTSPGAGCAGCSLAKSEPNAVTLVSLALLAAFGLRWRRNLS